MKNIRGFTLLEVLIAIVILAFISIFTVQAIQRAVSSKNKITKDIDRFAAVRDALRVMERDINMAFNYRDINIQLYNLAQTERKERSQKKKTDGTGDDSGATTGGGTTGATEGGAGDSSGSGEESTNNFELKKEVVLTQFSGKKNEINFTSRSHVRMEKDSQTSDQAEIGYQIKTCKHRNDPKVSSNCLWRRLSPYIDDDIEKGGKEVAILENVTTFELRYLGPGKDDDWGSEWISGEGADDTTKNKFPYAVEITLETKATAHGVEGKTTRMTMVAAVRNPNNPEKKGTEEATSEESTGQ